MIVRCGRTLHRLPRREGRKLHLVRAASLLLATSPGIVGGCTLANLTQLKHVLRIDPSVICSPRAGK